MDTFSDSQLGPATPDDGFDPVSEIRRLRQDLMLRLHQLRQSAAEVEEPVLPHREVLATPEVQPESGTILYVSPDFQRPDDVPVKEESTAFVDPVPIRPKIGASLRIVDEAVENTVVAESPGSLETPRKESPAAQVLGWINAVLVCIGAVGILLGLYHYRRFAGLQELAMTLLVVGTALVLVGIAGRLSHQHAKLQFAGTTGPGSW